MVLTRLFIFLSGIVLIIYVIVFAEGAFFFAANCLVFRYRHEFVSFVGLALALGFVFFNSDCPDTMV